MFKTLTAGTKFHLCITAGVGENVKVYIDGIFAGTAGVPIVSQTRQLSIQQRNYSEPVLYTDFIIAKKRIWAGDFTPPLGYNIV